MTRLLFLMLSLLLPTGQIYAAQAVDLYNVDVLVTNESSAVRQQAFIKGMHEIFIRISGDSIVMDKLTPPLASRYVSQFSYQPLEKRSRNAEGETLSHVLKIQYNGSAMEKYLRENGFPVWGEHRSEVVVWLVVRDGRTEYVLKQTDKSLIKSVTGEALKRRGILESWPLYDAQDKKNISIADLRGGFQKPVNKASKRYSQGPVLTASLSWSGKRWQSNWSLLMASGDHHWSLEDTDYTRLINKAVNRAADYMGVVFAIRGGANNLAATRVQVDVQGVNSVDKYRKVEDYLTNLSAVGLTKAYKVDANHAVFELVLRSNEQDFLNGIKNDARLLKALKVQMPLPVVESKAVEKKAVKNKAVEKKAIQQEAMLDAAIVDNKTAIPLDGAAPSATKMDDNIPPVQIPVYYYKLLI